MNVHFDGVLVTADFLRDVFKSSGVCKPLFHLPLALDLDRFLNLGPKKRGSPYVFGAVGAYDFRKNVDLITETFEKAFGLDNPDVALRLKLSYSLLGEEEAAKFAASWRGTNIQVVRGNVNEDDYLTFVRDIDCVINISRGEGYSIPAREAVAMGTPLILSDHFAHEDFSDLDSVAFVKAEVPVPALYPQINERFIGLQYMPHPQDVVAAFRRVYEQRDAYAARALANRDKARRWTVADLRERYFSLVSPATVSLRGGPETITPSGISTSHEFFYRRAHQFYGDRVARSARNVELFRQRPAKTVVIGNDGGFFSLFNRYASYLVWEKDDDPDRVVLPDWRADSIGDFFGSDKFTSFCYASRTEGNGWLKLFKPSPDVDDPSIYDDVDRLYDGAVIADGFNEYREPWLTYTNAYNLYQMPEFKRWRRWYNGIVSQHIIPLDNIQKRIDRNLAALGDGERLAVHIRHPSHAIEQPGARLSHTEVYVRAINAYIAERKLKNPRIFLATDQESTIEDMKRHFGSNLYFDTDVKRTSIDHDQSFEALDESERMREGHQIQHLTAADSRNWSSSMAAEVIADCYSLAGCEALFHIVSNISTAASYLNPDLEMVFVGHRHG
ncbi:hypothetical protein IP78_13815 [Brevundimonas sp. AAP58]|nr:hypothetical protein IP78_13815 [Brevundimonas sp. AAP58]